METDRTAKYGLYRDLVTIRPTTYRPPGRIPDAVDADDYPPMVPPPWSRPDRDVLADVMRAMQVIALIPPPPEVRAGSEAGGAETLGMMGIPVRVTNELPENVIIIGDRVLIRRGIGDWITFPLSALEYDADVTAQPARTYRAP
jgi:hypothetical protein